MSLNCRVGQTRPGARAYDQFVNAMARMGAGTPSVAEGADYANVRISNDYYLMLTLFRSHWISRRIVETPAQDMVRAWPKLTSEMPPQDIKLFDRCIDRTNTQGRILEAIKWARLYGGSGALIVIDGHEGMLEEPLDLDDVDPGSYRGLIPFDRWTGIWPDGAVSTDLNRPKEFGLPEFYNVGGQGSSRFRVHASRILRFIGPDVPSPEFQAQNYWGISVLEPAYEEIKKRDNMSWSILQRSFRAAILTQVNPELAQMLSGASMSTAALQQFQARMQAQNEMLSNQSMLVLPKDGSLQSVQDSFSGTAEVYQQFQLDIAGASQMPVTRLFGRTISGLGQSNDADERIYEERIAQEQHQSLKPQLDKLFPVICMSEFGEVPDDLDYDFPSVRVLNEEEKVNLAKTGSDAVIVAFNSGLISNHQALKELQQLSKTTGVFTNITDEDIEAASNSLNLNAGEQEHAPEAPKEDAPRSELAA